MCTPDEAVAVHNAKCDDGDKALQQLFIENITLEESVFSTAAWN